MQLGRTRLTPETPETDTGKVLPLLRTRRTLLEQLSGGAKRKGSPGYGRTLVSRLSTTSISRIQLTGVIYGPRHSLPVQILADSGAEGNFVDSDFVKENDFPVYKPTPKEVHAVDGRLLELITLKTELLKLTLSKNHHEFVVFCYNFPLYSCDSWCTLAQTDHSLHLVWSQKPDTASRID